MYPHGGFDFGVAEHVDDCPEDGFVVGVVTANHAARRHVRQGGFDVLPDLFVGVFGVDEQQPDRGRVAVQEETPPPHFVDDNVPVRHFRNVLVERGVHVALLRQLRRNLVGGTAPRVDGVNVCPPAKSSRAETGE